MKHNKSEHLSREALVALAGDKNARLPKHIQECPDCRHELEMLVEFNVAHRTRLSGPPASWINKAAMIMPENVVEGIVGRLAAKLTFDSWLAPEPVGVRGLGTTQRRQMRYETSGLTIDLRAEHDHHGWNMVAQVSGQAEVFGELRHGRTACHPDNDGVYQWEAKKPPSKLSILVDNHLIEFPKLKWTMPAKKKKHGAS